MDIIQKVRELAIEEIKKYWLPSLLHFEIGEQKALELTEKLNADSTIVQLGISLMDIKLGQAFAENRVTEHTQMSAEYAKTILDWCDLNDIYIYREFWTVWKRITEKFLTLALKRKSVRMQIATALSALRASFLISPLWEKGTMTLLLAWTMLKRNLTKNMLSFH